MLELIVKRGRALVDARALVILLRDGDELVVAASAGEARGRRRRAPHPDRGLDVRARSCASGRPERIATSRAGCASPPSALGVPDAQTALLVPLDVPRPRARRARRVRPPRRTSRSSAPRTSAAAARSRPARRRRSRPRRRSRHERLRAARWRPPSRSAAAGRASCTTRRCRRSAACRCCCRPRCAAATRAPLERAVRDEAVEQLGTRDREAAQRSSPSCARRRSTSSAWQPALAVARERACRERQGSRSTTRGRASAPTTAALAPSSRRPSTGSCRRR